MKYFLFSVSDKWIFIVILFLMDMCTCASIKSLDRCEKDYNGCLQEYIQRALPKFAKGMPEMGVESLDPLYVQKLDLALPGGLTIQFRQGYAKGLRKCVVEKARLIGNMLETQFVCNISIRGKYKSTGRLLMFPIDGDGDSLIKCRNVRVHNVLKLKTIVHENGEKHLEILNSNSNHTFDGRITYNFSNIFKRSPETSKIVLDFMNENWHMIAQEFGDPVVEFGVIRVLEVVKKFFKKVPLDGLLRLPVNFQIR